MRAIPEIDIWRAANLMIKRYGDTALEESATRADELAADGDHDGAATWRRITMAVEQLANNTPNGSGALTARSELSRHCRASLKRRCREPWVVLCGKPKSG
jgi:hypothetical protein